MSEFPHLGLTPDNAEDNASRYARSVMQLADAEGITFADAEILRERIIFDSFVRLGELTEDEPTCSYVWGILNDLDWQAVPSHVYEACCVKGDRRVDIGRILAAGFEEEDQATQIPNQDLDLVIPPPSLLQSILSKVADMEAQRRRAELILVDSRPIDKPTP